MSTLPVLSKYERARILQARAAELASGQLSTIQNPGTTDPVQLAKMEFEQGRIPKKIIRQLPNGSEEIHPITRLKAL